METIEESLYDYPKYYDLLFGSDWKAEFDFLGSCFQKHAKRPVRRLFEPACGTGRLLVKLADAGFEVSGNDLNANAVDYCNKRLERFGFPATAVVGDMSDFRLRRKVDAAFNTINSFRHLQSEKQAEGHLQCVATALAKGGIYVLGFHLTPSGDITCDEEAWSAQRGFLCVTSRMWSMNIDRRRRSEQVGMEVDVHTPTRSFRISEELAFRTYTVAQFRKLLSKVPSLELAETYDFAYRDPVKINARTEDVVYVLRKK